ncbi:multicopper oxidase domain-containing protein [Streptomyces sp. NPDC049040]|uniref:multicopper oxidase domain-containing protein n=1 Tax=Streptomyces sp. NPDC049040 TaxID=3365593 RepID=UPI00371A70E2
MKRFVTSAESRCPYSTWPAPVVTGAPSSCGGARGPNERGIRAIADWLIYLPRLCEKVRESVVGRYSRPSPPASQRRPAGPGPRCPLHRDRRPWLRPCHHAHLQRSDPGADPARARRPHSRSPGTAATCPCIRSPRTGSPSPGRSAARRWSWRWATARTSWSGAARRALTRCGRPRWRGRRTRRLQRLDPPVWHDTIGLADGVPARSVTFLVRYEGFTGRTVVHCHQLRHEDPGMMQTVEYVPDRTR